MYSPRQTPAALPQSGDCLRNDTSPLPLLGVHQGFAHRYNICLTYWQKESHRPFGTLDNKNTYHQRQ